MGRKLLFMMLQLNPPLRLCWAVFNAGLLPFLQLMAQQN